MSWRKLSLVLRAQPRSCEDGLKHGLKDWAASQVSGFGKLLSQALDSCQRS